MRIREIIKGFILIFIYLIIPSFIYILLKEILPIKEDTILLLVSQILITILLIYIYKKELKNDFILFKKNAKKMLKNTSHYYIIGFIIMIIINSIILAFFTKEIAANEETNRDLLNSMTLFAIPTMTLLGPICEEIIFRKSFSKAFNNDVLFVIFTGLIFGIGHVMTTGFTFETLFTLLPYASIGIAFSMIYVKNKNIFPCFFYHILHNTFTILIIFLA